MTTDLPPEASSWLADIDNALRNGSRMTRANLSFELLCGALGVDADALTPESHQDLPADLRIKALTETATRLGYEPGRAEGRKEALAEVAGWISQQQHKRMTTTKWSAYIDVAAEIGRLSARDITKGDLT